MNKELNMPEGILFEDCSLHDVPERHDWSDGELLVNRSPVGNDHRGGSWNIPEYKDSEILHDNGDLL